ncbi:hypothetical protein [Psychrobacter sp. DAB_AL43B]|nr:hypothetical protein [Psychrobacter sp. DAB_AL43B]
MTSHFWQLNKKFISVNLEGNDNNDTAHEQTFAKNALIWRKSA